MPTNGVYLYERFSEDSKEKAIVVMNGRDEELTIDMSRYKEIIPKEKKYRDVITGEELELIPESGSHTFAPREIHILEEL